MILANNGIISTNKGDAIAFITAANITDTTQQNAIITLVNDLKSSNIWSKMRAIYPFVGGTASSHRFNLKDPRQVSGAFYITFYGGGTHSLNGYQPDGATAYGNTSFIANNHLTNSSGHISIYSRTNVEELSCDFGASKTPSPFALEGPEQVILTRYTGLGLVSVYGDYNSSMKTPNADSRGYYINNRNSATNTTSFKNGVKVIDAVGNSGLSTTELVISAESAAGPPAIQRFSTRQIAFATIGDGLSDSEATALYNAVQTFNTTLNRQV